MPFTSTRFAAPLAAAVVIVAGGILAGCGSGNSDSATGPDQAALEATSAKIVAGVRAKDPGALCDLFQPSQIKPAFGGPAGCLSFAQRAVTQDSPLATLDVDRVAVNGNRAIVTYKQDPPGQVLFAKENGNWYVSLDAVVRLRKQAQKSGSGK